MYHYILSRKPGEDLFYEQCGILEKRIPALRKLGQKTEPDGSAAQMYQKGEWKLSVRSSQRFGGIFINSEFDLKPYFPKVRELFVNMTLGLDDDEEARDMFSL